MLVAYDLRPRCRSCGKLLAEKVTRPWVIRCGRCKTVNDTESQTEQSVTIEEELPWRT